MIDTPAGQVERFRVELERHLGLQLDESRQPLLSELLRRRLQALGLTAEAYFERLQRPSLPAEEQRGLARELTVCETYFFRNADQLRALAERVLPERTRARSTSGLRMLSAACASGEEPYTLAMILLNQQSGLGLEGQVRAVDINPLMLERAHRARFGAWSLRETPEEIRQRWFRPEGREWVLDPAVRALVHFEEANLAHPDPGLWLPEHYDVIFCRNVMMYLRPEVTRELVARIAHSLAPGGFLFLGHAETLRGLSTDFHLCHTHDTFYYQRRGRAPGALASSRPPGPEAPVASLPPPSPEDASWVEMIQRSSARIADLSGQVRPPADPGPAHPQLERILELLAQERFQEALSLLEAGQAQGEGTADLLLLRACLLLHSGHLSEAERVCHQLLRLDELSAGAHYLLALCREEAGDAAAAIGHDQTAAYLDPSFAMPRLHLGLMARRRHDLPTARRELAQALLLVQREDPARVLLFGGGFSRPALVALCRAELQRVEVGS